MPHVDLLFSELNLNAPVRVKYERMAIVVIRTESGVRAYKDVCPHAFWPLSKGTLSEGVLKCPGHGWEFQADTGRCINVPGYCLNAVAVIVDGNNVQLQWEDLAPANRPNAAEEPICAHSIAPLDALGTSEGP
jgi:nitrite reductase/ring-hydroxylating ferredoxin subunit